MSALFHRWPKRVAAAVVAAALALAGLATWLLSATASPPTPQAVPSTVYTGPGFDPCWAPDNASMDAWLQSPYRGIGVYLGGLRYAPGCKAQNTANLTKEWVGRQAALGWRFLPLYVGSQAQYKDSQGNYQSDFDTLTTDTAFQLGSSEADDAANLARGLNFPPTSVIYNDMENYDHRYTPLVLAYSQGWTQELHRAGYRSGWYSSSATGIKDQAAAYGPGSPDVVDIANWNNTNTTDDPNVKPSQWANHQRVHQTQGGHQESYGGFTLNIDTDWFDVGQASRATVERLAGFDRDLTAVLASVRTFDCHGCGNAGHDQAKAAVLSRDDTFADALGGSALAAQAGGPLLLTAPQTMNQSSLNELRRILWPGSTVYLLGGTKALSPAVEHAVAAAGFKTQRVAGADRFETAVNIARTVSPHGAPSSVLVATGTDFPDALAAGAAAGALGISAQTPVAGAPAPQPGDVSHNGAVVVLSDGAKLPAASQAYLAGMDPAATKMYGVGGKAVAAVHTAFPSWQNWVTFTPLFGSDRYGTAVAVAQRFSYLPTSVVVASGANWPDALSGGAMAAHRGVPLLLTDPKVLAAATGYYLGGKNNPITTATLVGGTAAISAASASALGDAFSYPGQWDLTTIH
ncbi:glycoside hydrolase domain-containing protein [Catenulispora subtropica]|uniref:Rv2525c-like glycoside hydrolase-like domain-containing protein n=1 Tax=Catenulispora subtropica TaxID=450798 RepID=A0ABN2QTU0_9ACTN